ncbi:1-deoxy-D-xylulose-5-phosphate synthase, partial [Escherichia coli]|nr:1-deoxy-D-xylulose-5-phosphate synthase [Escherichia coli]MWL01782.1 1-deoxy-D-xylulose-5-phosphate synthase [Escherichia coli]
IVANDNGRSYTPTVGGIADQLTTLRTDRRYEEALDVLRRSISGTPLVGRAAYEWLHGVKMGLKDVLAPQGLFADLGMKYVGPVDGHDIRALERALTQAKRFGGPVIVHVLTQKGRGFAAAETNEEDRFHSVGK